MRQVVYHSQSDIRLNLRITATFLNSRNNQKGVESDDKQQTSGFRLCQFVHLSGASVKTTSSSPERKVWIEDRWALSTGKRRRNLTQAYWKGVDRGQEKEMPLPLLQSKNLVIAYVSWEQKHVDTNQSVIRALSKDCATSSSTRVTRSTHPFTRSTLFHCRAPLAMVRSLACFCARSVFLITFSWAEWKYLIHDFREFSTDRAEFFFFFWVGIALEPRWAGHVYNMGSSKKKCFANESS